MAGHEVHYPGSLLMNILDACGLQCASFGRWGDTAAEAMTIINRDRPIYRRLLWDGDEIVGAVFVGPANDLGMLRNAFPRLRFVHIVRRHKLRQALSTARALQTGLWKVQQGKTEVCEPQFDAELIEQSLKEAERQEKIWHTFFQRIDIAPFQIEYEELCRDYEGSIRSVLDFLKISLPRDARIGPPVTIRQADEISRIWEERFLTERPSTYLPAHG